MISFLYCLFGVNYIFMLGSKIEACKPSRNDLKIVSVIKMTFLYDARYSVVLLRQKNEVKLEGLKFCQFLADFRVLGPICKNSKCHNSINIGS